MNEISRCIEAGEVGAIPGLWDMEEAVSRRLDHAAYMEWIALAGRSLE